MGCVFHIYYVGVGFRWIMRPGVSPLKIRPRIYNSTRSNKVSLADRSNFGPRSSIRWNWSRDMARIMRKLTADSRNSPDDFPDGQNIPVQSGEIRYTLTRNAKSAQPVRAQPLRHPLLLPRTLLFRPYILYRAHYATYRRRISHFEILRIWPIRSARAHIGYSYVLCPYSNSRNARNALDKSDMGSYRDSTDVTIVLKRV